MCIFPDIPYDPYFGGLSNQSIPQGTYTYLKNNEIVDAHLVRLLDGIPDMEKLEKYIKKKIETYDGNDDNSLYDIFCLIQIWGGFRGITAFRCNKPFREKWENSIKEQYHLLVKTCMGITPNKDAQLNICKNDIDTVLNAVQTIKDNVPGLGVSFITKHTRFWLQRNNEKNPLPIFDSIMANGLLNSSADITLLKQYWICMIEKAVSLNNEMSLLALERQLFNHFIDKKKSGNKKTTEIESKIEKTKQKKNNCFPFRRIKENDIAGIFHDELLIGYMIPIDNKTYKLFVCHKDGPTGYFCELRYCDDENTDIMNNDSVKKIMEKYGGVKVWTHNQGSPRPSFKYQSFGNDKNAALCLMQKILNDVNAPQNVMEEIKKIVDECR